MWRNAADPSAAASIEAKALWIYNRRSKSVSLYSKDSQYLFVDFNYVFNLFIG
jgi:hypothetical protein